MARKYAARQPWMAQILERKPAKIATVALANKAARIAWAVKTRKKSSTLQQPRDRRPAHPLIARDRMAKE